MTDIVCAGGPGFPFLAGFLLGPPERSTLVYDRVPPSDEHSRSVASPADNDFVLAPGERLLWEGAPKHVRIARKQDLVVVSFLIVPLYYLFPTFDKPGGWFIFGLTAGMIVVKGVHRYLAMRASAYMVTDRRVVAWARGQQTISRSLGELGPPQVKEHKNGTGTITFGGPGAPLVSVDEDPPAGTPKPPPSPELDGIEQYRQVLDLITKAQRRSRRPRPTGEDGLGSV
ncbi:hypothetical protein ABTX61_14555 [Amycolatopsis japonica]|uniref:hypothetical protein n=1 Tax=Amycolatopsis japonica TaxID=208439 RepID=UPI00332FB845